ncbi:MAG: glycine zipper 2TM domain-containing protein [Rickettsiella sp.]|nr:glycine zipper 2TM domain-containing protein [Rickettsiella sp.]
MKKFNSFLLIGVALIGLTACDTMSPDQRAVAGGLTGAVAGGLLGNTVGGGTGRTVATIGGAAIGAMAGSALGRGTGTNTNNQVRYYQGRDGKLHPVQ